MPDGWNLQISSKVQEANGARNVGAEKMVLFVSSGREAGTQRRKGQSNNAHPEPFLLAWVLYPASCSQSFCGSAASREGHESVRKDFVPDDKFLEKPSWSQENISTGKATAMEIAKRGEQLPNPYVRGALQPACGLSTLARVPYVTGRSERARSPGQ